MIRYLAAILLLFAGTYINATDNPGFIKGKVYASQSLEPLPSATVIYGKDKGITTNADGSYLIKTEPGNINIIFRFVGYKQVAHTILVTSADTVFLDVEMEYDIAEIDQIVVSAGKIEQRVAELTVSVNIIRPKALQVSHLTDAAELISRSSGIEIIDGQASVRGGSGFSYGAGSRVLALVDGLPVLSADAGNIKWQFLPLENISQIEIIKGASSVMYGSSALNGIINFRTADAGNEPETKFYIETGIFGKPSRQSWIWWDSPRSFSSTSFSHLRKHGNTDLGVALHLLTDNGYRRLNDERLGRLNVKLKHHDRKLDGLSYGVNLNAGVTEKTDFVLWENSWSGALKQDELTANELHGSLLTIDPYISLNRMGGAKHELRTRLQSSENKYAEAGHNNSRALSFLAEYQLIYSLFGLLDMNSGLFQNYSHINSPFYGYHDALNLAGYSQAAISVAERFKFVAGLRIEHNSLNGLSDRIVPLLRAGINYRLQDYTFLRASFGQGYRYPSIAEKHAATTLGSVRIVANPDIRSESGWTSEAGIKQGIITGNLNGYLDLAVFYSRYNDMIEFVFGVYPDPAGESFSYGFMASNVEQSEVYGAEFEFGLSGFAGRVHNSVSGGYVFTYPVEKYSRYGENGSNYLKYRRKHTLKLIFESSFRRVEFGFSLNASSAILNIDNVFLNELTRETILPGFYDYWNESRGGHLLIDPHAGYIINDRYKMSAVIKNLLNTEYMGRPGDIMPHRNFSIRFSASF
jgi:outer membrane cobalamin receptor